MNDPLADIARRLAACLFRRRQRVVFAESCTAGLVAASLAATPGISQWLCGSAVTYRSATKSQWLQVSAENLQRFTAVSEPVARQMAEGVLRNTPEAEFSAAVTGHLGPDVPMDLDGVVYIAIAARSSNLVRCRQARREQLQASKRLERQREAAQLVLRRMLEILDADAPPTV